MRAVAFNRYIGTIPELFRTLSPAHLGAAPALCFLNKSLFSSHGIQQAAGNTSHLNATELHYAAKLARLSGLCYGVPENLAARLQAEGMQVQAQGQTSFTR